jgi:hypothetical protein
MASDERPVLWVSRPAVRFWGFLVALASLVASVAMSVFLGAHVVTLVGIGASLVAVVMGIARPHVFRDGQS